MPSVPDDNRQASRLSGATAAEVIHAIADYLSARGAQDYPAPRVGMHKLMTAPHGGSVQMRMVIRHDDESSLNGVMTQRRLANDPAHQ